MIHMYVDLLSIIDFFVAEINRLFLLNWLCLLISCVQVLMCTVIICRHNNLIANRKFYVKELLIFCFIKNLSNWLIISDLKIISTSNDKFIFF